MNWWKKYGDKVGMGVCSRTATICPMQHPQATPAHISLHVVRKLSIRVGVF